MTIPMPPHTVARPATPGPITLVRLLAVVQLVLGLFTCMFLGFLALLGLTWPNEDGSGPSALAYATAAVFVLALGVTIALAVLAGRLRPGADGVRRALLVVETVVVAIVLAALACSDASLGGLVAWPTVHVACGIGTIVALLQPKCRDWCRRPLLA